MKLYVVRHGDAADAPTDAERPLSSTGQHQVRQVAEFLRSQHVAAPTIWHSTRLRAKQTAELLADAFGSSVLEREGLGPNDTVNGIAGELRHRTDEDLIIVSHLPFVSLLASELVAGTPAAAWNFGTGAVLCLEREPTGRWWADWFIHPEMIPG